MTSDITPIFDLPEEVDLKRHRIAPKVSDTWLVGAFELPFKLEEIGEAVLALFVVCRDSHRLLYGPALFPKSELVAMAAAALLGGMAGQLDGISPGIPSEIVFADESVYDALESPLAEEMGITVSYKDTLPEVEQLAASLMAYLQNRARDPSYNGGRPISVNLSRASVLEAGFDILNTPNFLSGGADIEAQHHRYKDDPSTCGMAKRMLMEGHQHGFDVTSEEALQEWMSILSSDGGLGELAMGGGGSSGGRTWSGNRLFQRLRKRRSERPGPGAQSATDGVEGLGSDDLGRGAQGPSPAGLHVAV